jgi:alpha-1,2-mannosyltransferase
MAVTGVTALLLALVALAGPVARRYGRPRFTVVFAALGLALLTAPVRGTLGFGCLDLLLFGLVTVDVTALRRSAWARSRATWWPDRASSRLRKIWATGAWAFPTTSPWPASWPASTTRRAPPC